MTQIDSNVAIALVQNYSKNHWPVINASAALAGLRNVGATVDSRCAWFSMDDIQTFINDVKTATAANCQNIGDAPLGVRFYYGEYPAADSPMYGNSIPANLQQYAGMLTLLMVPTYFDGTYNTDFDPNYATAGAPKAWSAIVAPAPAPPVMLTEMDHASLVPPPYFLVPTPGQKDMYEVGTGFMNLADHF